MQMIYKGLSPERKKALLDAKTSGMTYPLERGVMAPKYHLLKDDKVDEGRQAYVSKYRAQDKADFIKQAKASIERVDAERSVGGLVFKKGVPIEIPDKHALRTGKTPKVDQLVASGEFELVKQKDAKA